MVKLLSGTSGTHHETAATAEVEAWNLVNGGPPARSIKLFGSWAVMMPRLDLLSAPPVEYAAKKAVRELVRRAARSGVLHKDLAWHHVGELADGSWGMIDFGQAEIATGSQPAYEEVMLAKLGLVERRVPVSHLESRSALTLE